MKIRQIDLIGFKSFADRVPISLHHGITCIVGPNGCGKSNIVDAFRWVLGEQSAKSLRGERMEEVIFQGTTTKKQKGMAEVILIVAQGGTMTRGSEGNGQETAEEDDPLNFIVSRRLYRSGESEYILNKRQCRLRDIRDIFLDTGLDVKSYSILDQGRITDIFTSKPYERRFLIEEIAGIMKYKVRKAEALAKLDTSKQNLLRISDIVFEVKRQMNSLDRQVKKAERYRRLMLELKETELRIARRNHSEHSRLLKTCLSLIEANTEESSREKAGLSTIEMAIEKKRLEIAEQESALMELDSRLHEKERAIAEAEQRLALLNSTIENRGADIARLVAQQEETEKKSSELSEKIDELDKLMHSYEAENESLANELGQKRELLAAMEGAFQEREEAIERKRRELFSISEILSSKNNELYRFQSALEAISQKEVTTEADIAATDQQLRDIETAISETGRAIHEETTDLLALQSERDLLRSEISGIKDAIEEKKGIISAERELLASHQARLASLRELMLDKNLADFISEYRSTSGGAERVLSDMLIAGQDFERAIEAALAQKINALIVDKKDSLLHLITVVKEKKFPRTSMLFTAWHRHSDKRSETVRIQHELILARASEVISFENTGFHDDALTAAREIIISILQDIYITRDLESALEVRRAFPSDAETIVTLDGETVSAEGFIDIGQGTGILVRKREIKELDRTIQKRQDSISILEGELNDLSGRLNSKRDYLQQCEEKLLGIEKNLSLSTHTLATRQEEKDRLSRRLSLLQSERSGHLAERETLSPLIQAKLTEIATFEETKTSLSDEIAFIQNSLVDDKKGYEDERIHFSEMKAAIAAHREKIEATKKERDGIAVYINELADKKTAIFMEIKDAEDKIAASHAELQSMKKIISELVAEVEQIKKAWDDKREIISSEKQAIAVYEQEVKRLRSKIEAITQVLVEQQSQAFEERLTVEAIEKEIDQKYGLKIGQHEATTEGTDPASDEEQLNRLHEKIRDLGPVNMGTIEEYDELKNRHDFLSQQQQDLTQSIAELEEAIGRINTTTKRKLREAYEALRTKFLEVFTSLFGGGKADILMTDEDNILETGLEIVAQPPGKKLQNINLLSGGEKALTSLAILFAGFLIKPSPLCILDEVDAALDESNTVRFARMIKDLSKDTQFIVITHNRVTMEVADYLYGITMEEAGVSKVISLEFSEVATVTTV